MTVTCMKTSGTAAAIKAQIEATNLHIRVSTEILQACCFPAGNVSLDADLKGRTTDRHRRRKCSTSKELGGTWRKKLTTTFRSFRSSFPWKEDKDTHMLTRGELIKCL